MAKKKAAAKTFPKPQGVEGEGDRFVPPDRMDQLNADPSDRAQLVNVQDLGADIEILDDSGAGDGEGDEGGEGHETPPKRGKDDAGETDEGGARTRGRRARANERDDGDDDEEGNRSYSRRVRARINRERTLRQQADARVENAERRARSVEERLAKLERVTTEVKENADVKALEAKIAQLQKDIAAALEAEDTKKAFDLQVQLGDANADLKLLKRDLEAARRQQITDEEKRKEEDEQAKRTNGTQQIAQTTIDWKEANRGWFTRERYKDARADAIAIDLEIQRAIDAGEHDFEKYSEEHFELLNDQLAELYPDLPIFNLDGSEYDAEDDGHEERDMSRDRDRGGRDRDRRAPTNGRRPAVSAGNSTRRSGRREQSEADLARQGKVQLSEGDFQQMRLYGLDPKNAEHKKRFARERMRSILTEDRRGDRS